MSFVGQLSTGAEFFKFVMLLAFRYMIQYCFPGDTPYIQMIGMIVVLF